MSKRSSVPAVSFVHPTLGEMPGYVVGFCGHRVAQSEWRAGFGVCERCDEIDYVIVADAVEWLSGASLSGSLTARRVVELLLGWVDRDELTAAHVQLIVARYPDVDDYQRQVNEL